jgi:hypothetical protein
MADDAENREGKIGEDLEVKKYVNMHHRLTQEFGEVPWFYPAGLHLKKWEH